MQGGEGGVRGGPEGWGGGHQPAGGGGRSGSEVGGALRADHSSQGGQEGSSLCNICHCPSLYPTPPQATLIS